MRFFTNPFYIYTIVYTIAILMVYLGWSYLITPLQINLIGFILSTIIISLALGRYISKRFSPVFTYISFRSRDINILLLLLGCFLLEFIYAGYVPLLSIINLNTEFEHFGGIPTFHVFLTTFSVFYSCLLFYKYLCTKKIKCLIVYILSISPAILMLNRGMLMTILISCIYMYVYQVRHKILHTISKLTIVCIAILYIFAHLGQTRSGDESGAIIEAYADPSEVFRNSGLNSVLLWPYMYITSPIANLQKCINEYTPVYSLKGFVLNCIIPDFISKRIDVDFHIPTPPLISSTFNVSTMYYDAYIYMGYIGMYLLFIYQIIISMVIWFSFKRSKYRIITTCIASTSISLGAFTNMWVFSAVSFPIIWSYIMMINVKKY